MRWRSITWEPPWPSKTAKKWSSSPPASRQNAGRTETASSISRDNPQSDTDPKATTGATVRVLFSAAGGSAEATRFSPQFEVSPACSILRRRGSQHLAKDSPSPAIFTHTSAINGVDRFQSRSLSSPARVSRRCAGGGEDGWQFIDNFIYIYIYSF